MTVHFNSLESKMMERFKSLESIVKKSAEDGKLLETMVDKNFGIVRNSQLELTNSLNDLSLHSDENFHSLHLSMDSLSEKQDGISFQLDEHTVKFAVQNKALNKISTQQDVNSLSIAKQETSTDENTKRLDALNKTTSNLVQKAEEEQTRKAWEKRQAMLMKWFRGVGTCLVVAAGVAAFVHSDKDTKRAVVEIVSNPSVLIAAVGGVSAVYGTFQKISE